MYAPMTHIARLPHPIIIWLAIVPVPLTRLLHYTWCIIQCTYCGACVLWLTTNRGLVWLRISSFTDIPTHTGRTDTTHSTSNSSKKSNHGRGVQSLWRAHRLHSPSRYCLSNAFSFRFSSSSVCFSLSRASLSSSTWSEQFHGSIYHTLPSS